MAKANAQVEITASSSRLIQGLTAAGAKFKSWAGSVASSMGSAFKRVNKALEPGDTAKRAIGNFAGDMMGRGFDAVIGAAGDVRDFERNLIRFQLATDGSAASTAAMRKEVAAISRDTGVAREAVLAGAQAYVGFTGDAAGAAAAAKLFADVSVATGASVTDVAQGMAALKTSMGITAKEGEAAFSALIVQGKGGAVEIKDMAGELAALAPQFALFKGGKGVEGLRELGAGFQVIMKNSATASDAATKYSALMTSLNDPRTLKELRRMGVQVKDNKGKLLEASTVFANIAKSKELFAKENLSKAFGRQEARLAVLALKEHIGTYNDLRKAAEDTGAVQRDKMTFLESDAGRLDKAMNSLKVSIAEAFTPARIEAFTRAITDLVAHVGPLVEGLGKIAEHTLGQAFGVGKSIRGLISGDGNIFKEQLGAARVKRLGLAGLGTSDDMTFSERALQRNAAGFDSARSGILGAERDEKVTKESIRAAFIASQQRGGFEATGAATAGSAYLRAANVTAEQAAEQWTKEIAASNERGLKMVADAIAKMNPTVQIGDNQVARATTKATDARRNAQ
jgi:TP901 family phage tail tape measure protein